MKYSPLFALLTLACAAAPVGGRSDHSDETWVVASDLDNYPFAAVDASGGPYGRDVEMMELLAKDCGARIEWRRMPFEELLGSVQNNEADLVCATMGITPERAEIVAFTEPYFATELVVVLRTGFGADSILAKRLAGRSVHAARGTTSEIAVRESLPDAMLVLERKGEVSSLDFLMNGEVDALVMDGPAGAALVAEGDGMLELAAENLAPEYYAIVLSRDRNDGLGERLDAALEAMRADGRMAELDRRYEVEPSASFLYK